MFACERARCSIGCSGFTSSAEQPLEIQYHPNIGGVEQRAIEETFGQH